MPLWQSRLRLVGAQAALSRFSWCTGCTQCVLGLRLAGRDGQPPPRKRRSAPPSVQPKQNPGTYTSAGVEAENLRELELSQARLRDPMLWGRFQRNALPGRRKRARRLQRRRRRRRVRPRSGGPLLQHGRLRRGSPPPPPPTRRAAARVPIAGPRAGQREPYESSEPRK